jgi:flagellar basal-body rod protein FlgB
LQDIARDQWEVAMPLDMYGMLDLHGRALGVANQRLELLADNIANADTPGYKARDLDFGAAMASAGAGGDLPLAGTAHGHVTTGGSTGPATPLYRMPDQPSADGNTVDTQRENAAFAETAVRYQTSLTFLQARIAGLRNAITGGR